MQQTISLFIFPLPLIPSAKCKSVIKRSLNIILYKQCLSIYKFQANTRVAVRNLPLSDIISSLSFLFSPPIVIC